jgi:hypothetical protein
MRWFYSFLMCTALVIGGCGPKAIEVQSKVANDVALAANAIAPVLLATEQAEGDKAIDAAADKAAAKAALVVIQKKWDPIWISYRAVAVAQDAWATALEKKGDTTAAVQALQAAFCKLKVLLPPEIKIPAPVAIIVCLEVGQHGK